MRLALCEAILIRIYHLLSPRRSSFSDCPPVLPSLSSTLFFFTPDLQRVQLVSLRAHRPVHSASCPIGLLPLAISQISPQPLSLTFYLFLLRSRARAHPLSPLSLAPRNSRVSRYRVRARVISRNNLFAGAFISRAEHARRRALIMPRGAIRSFFFSPFFFPVNRDD